MSDRDDCRRLLDTVPDGALAIVKTALENLQGWRPPRTRSTPPEVMHHVREMEELRDKFLGGNWSGSWELDDGRVAGVAEDVTAQNPANGECTHKTFRVFRGFPLEITQSFLLQNAGRTLVYGFRVRGLRHQESHRMEFYQSPSNQ
jgi:hypothetical protein